MYVKTLMKRYLLKVHKSSKITTEVISSHFIQFHQKLDKFIRNNFQLIFKAGKNNKDNCCHAWFDLRRQFWTEDCDI